MNKKFTRITILGIMFALAACTPSGPATATNSYPQPDNATKPPLLPTSTSPVNQPEVKESLIKSEQERVVLETSAQDYQGLAQNINAFGYDLYHILAEGSETNIFFSPYSISQALTMTFAGSHGETESEMANVLHFTLPQGDLHNQLNGLDQSLYQVPDFLKDQEDAFQLNIANALWGQAGYPFRTSYLDQIAKDYSAGIHVVDFVNAAEKARSIINEWVADQTNQKILDLIPAGALDSFTRLVLTNAIYFNAAWQMEFNEDLTKPSDFVTADQQIVSVDMMMKKNRLNYQFSDDIQMVEIPYLNSRYSMVLIMPRQGSLAEFGTNLSLEQYADLVDTPQFGEVILRMPKFKFESSFSASSLLKELGMNAPFSSSADFSGMYETGAEPLFISDVIHKAFVAVDEQGTEAAAATAVIMGATSVMPEEDPVELVFDHPFMFLIRDRESGLILFMGNLVNPLD